MLGIEWEWREEEGWSDGGMGEGGRDEGGECMFCSTETISSHLILPFIFPLL